MRQQKKSCCKCKCEHCNPKPGSYWYNINEPAKSVIVFVKQGVNLDCCGYHCPGYGPFDSFQECWTNTIIKLRKKIKELDEEKQKTLETLRKLECLSESEVEEYNPHP